MLAAAVMLGLGALSPLASESGDRVHHLEIELSDWRGLAGGYSLKMIPAGEISRDGDAPLGPRRISAEARDSLRALLNRERFFDLRRSYGPLIADGRVRTITVRLDGRYHSAQMNDIGKSVKTVGELGRLLRVWYGVLRTFSDTGDIRIESGDRVFVDTPR